MSNRNRGFTLIELLVVMSIISILLTIVVQASMQSVVIAREHSTRSKLARLSGVANFKAQRLQRLQMRYSGILHSSVEGVAVDKQFPSLPVQTREILIRKLQLGRVLPQDQSERWSYAAGTTVERALLEDNEERDDDISMTDAWGNPIRFLRWPTELFKTHPELLPGVCNHDPEDPLNSLSGMFSPGLPFSTKVPILMPEPCKPSVFLFVSSGEDGQFGFDMPLGKVTSEDELADNLWSTVHLRP